jgi:hypothetical protein
MRRAGHAQRANRRKRPSRVFAAFYADWCRSCGDGFYPGTFIRFDVYGRLVHEHCVPLKPPETLARRPTGREERNREARIEAGTNAGVPTWRAPAWPEL